MLLLRTDVLLFTTELCLCAQGNEDTFAFLQGVLKEVLALFPSKYIHIGGDEVRPVHSDAPRGPPLD